MARSGRMSDSNESPSACDLLSDRWQWPITPEAMSLEPTFEDQDTLADTFRRHRSRMTTRELASAALGGGGFAAAVGALLVLAPPGPFALGPAALCVLVLALATRVHVDTPADV